MIIENKIKCVNGGRKVWNFHRVTHTPQNVCVLQFEIKLDVSQNHKNKIWNWIKIQTINGKQVTIIHVMCLMFQSRRTELTHTIKPRMLEKEINI